MRKEEERRDTMGYGAGIEADEDISEWSRYCLSWGLKPSMLSACPRQGSRVLQKLDEWTKKYYNAGVERLRIGF